MTDSHTYDAVVIGSGLGGLTAAALLAKAGRSVCVLERNTSLGGAASGFKVGALQIEASLHQTADPRDYLDPKHTILSDLGLLDELEWIPVAPFYRISGGPLDAPFDLPVGLEQALTALAERFPRSRHGMARLLGEIGRLTRGLSDLDAAHGEGSTAKLMRGAFAMRSTITHWRSSLHDLLQHHLGDDEAAKFALAGNLTYYADDPRKLWWLFFAVAQGSYLGSGGVFIKGGSRALSMKLAKVVNRSGGRVLLGRKAVAIETDGEGRPVAVRHADGKGGAEDRISTRLVLANCAPLALADMVEESLRPRLQQTYAHRELSISLFSAHFGLKEPAARFGLGGFSTILLPDEARALTDTPQLTALMGSAPAGKLPILGIANYGAIDAGLDPEGPALLSVVGADRMSNWQGLAQPEEKERRARWLDAILAELDRRYPGIAGAVSDRMFLNARSMQGFLGTPGGAAYGFAPLPPDKSIWRGLPRSPATPLPGVFLASSFGGSGGFTGAMVAGSMAARMALNAPA